MYPGIIQHVKEPAIMNSSGNEMVTICGQKLLHLFRKNNFH